MLINDSSNVERRKFFAAVEQNNITINDALREEYKHAYLVGNNGGLEDEFARMGQVLSSSELEKKLKALNSNILIEPNPYQPQMRVVYFVLPDGEKKYISAFEVGPVPEFCIFTFKETWDIDPASLNPNFTISRKDVDFKEDENGVYVEDSQNSRPGLKKYRIPWHISKMGWRTILLRLLSHKVVTLGDIYRNFCAADNREWAAKTGAQNIKGRF